ncbi:hypothetical protein CSKR_104293 [Clonorchis sinensis]|uniref:Uncharacterized protein n=1 Tax=Clonorchis sinensis TaxID=79923 RepID=A0A419Q128_CLOSI|nr:hypothetical protein CSKR_104293 [Clonorchis sinensis]
MIIWIASIIPDLFSSTLRNQSQEIDVPASQLVQMLEFRLSVCWCTAMLVSTPVLEDNFECKAAPQTQVLRQFVWCSEQVFSKQNTRFAKPSTKATGEATHSNQTILDLQFTQIPLNNGCRVESALFRNIKAFRASVQLYWVEEQVYLVAKRKVGPHPRRRQLPTRLSLLVSVFVLRFQVIHLSVASTRHRTGRKELCEADGLLACRLHVYTSAIYEAILSAPYCHATRRKHEGWNTAWLPKPRQGTLRSRGRVRTTDLPVSKFAL